MFNKKKLYLSIFMLLCLLFIPFKIVSAYCEDKVYTSASSSDDFEDDKVMVVLTHEASMNDKTYSRRDFKNISCKNVSELFANTDESSKDKDYKKILCLDLKTSSKEKVLDVCGKLMSRDDVLYAGPSYNMKYYSTANDTYISEQWAVNNINLPQTWDYVTGSSSVLVGVIDSGIDSSHPDLSSRVNWNLSKSFVSGYGKYDNIGHGTHVAGIIGAIGNNGQGVSGVNWNVKLVSLRAVGNNLNLSAVLSAIDYANENNIPILNLSGGFETSESSSDLDYIFRTALENYYGLLVCAVGNNNYNIDDNIKVFPACCTADNIISVGAHNAQNGKWYFSNYGTTSVDIYAPGVDILSTYPNVGCSYDITFSDETKLCELPLDMQINLIEQVEQDDEDFLTWEYIQDRLVFHSNFGHEPSYYRCSDHYENGYHKLSGTSMATPYVSGVAALLLAHNPELNATELKNAILNGSDSISITLSDQSTQTVKKLNALKALNLTHDYSYTSKSNSSHLASCINCDYSISETHNFSYIWLNGSSHRATCTDCSYRTTKPHAALSGTSTCVVCGGRVDVGFVGTYSLRNRIYITTAGSYILPNGNIILVEEDLEDYLNGTLIY